MTLPENSPHPNMQELIVDTLNRVVQFNTTNEQLDPAIIAQRKFSRTFFSPMVSLLIEKGIEYRDVASVEDILLRTLSIPGVADQQMTSNLKSQYLQPGRRIDWDQESLAIRRSFVLNTPETTHPLVQLRKSALTHLSPQGQQQLAQVIV